MAGSTNGARKINADPHQSKIYSEFSRFYDKIFERIFFPRIARVIASLKIPPGARVLELGVGTGLSLSAYPSHCNVLGVDLAQDMLDQAADKVREHGWTHIYSLSLQHQLFGELRPGVFFNDGQRYLAPPPLAWVTALLTGLGAANAFYAWLVISVAAIVGCWWLAAPGRPA